MKLSNMEASEETSGRSLMVSLDPNHEVSDERPDEKGVGAEEAIVTVYA